jgi:hypothetical protein
VPALPPEAAWSHRDARSGFEVLHVRADGDGYAFAGTTAAVEDGRTWVVDYAIRVDAAWCTRSGRVTGRSADGIRTLAVEADGRGSWRVDGVPAPHLDGCRDLDLESSAMTNALPVHRLALAAGQRAAAPAAYVRAPGLAVERLEQVYLRLPDDGPGQRYDYGSPAFGFRAVLVYDASGLVLDYPGIAVRVA